MFGVLKSVQPLKPTSFQPRSSATMWTMLGCLAAPEAGTSAQVSATINSGTLDLNSFGFTNGSIRIPQIVQTNGDYRRSYFPQSPVAPVESRDEPRAPRWAARRSERS